MIGVGEESKEAAKNVGGILMELKAKEYKKFEDIKRTREDAGFIRGNGL